MKLFLKHLIFIILIILVSKTHVYSQKMVLEYGDLNFLKNTSKIRLIFDYDTMVVGEFSKEEDYVNQKIAEHEKSKPGSGNLWLQEWKGNRVLFFEPTFEKYLNYKIVNFNKEISGNFSKINTEYTLIVKTTLTDVGYYGYGPFHKDTRLDITYLFVDSSNPNHVLAKTSCMRLKVFTRYWDIKSRLQYSYGKAGSFFGKFLVKHLSHRSR